MPAPGVVADGGFAELGAGGSGFSEVHRADDQAAADCGDWDVYRIQRHQDGGGAKANGFGKLITIEFDPDIFAKAKQRIDLSGLRAWIAYRNASSLDTPIDGTIDLLFSDSHLTIREQEIRRFLPQIDPRGLILIHDASSHFKVVREAALRLEQEGLISVVLLSTPRGLVIAQKRAGRK